MRLLFLARVMAASAASTALASAQANDDCAGAIAVALGTTAFDTTAATLSPEAWPCAGGGGPDLWYSYTAANTNDVRIETCGIATHDTALEAFSGTCGALTPLHCNDDACGLQSGITITGVAAGTTYLFRVGGFASSTGSGAFDVSEIAPPPNDECATAAPVTLGPTAFDSLGATDSPEPWTCLFGGNPGGSDLWYSYTAGSAEDLSFSLCGSTFDTALVVYTGSCGSLLEVACNDDACALQSSAIVSGVTAGTVYTVRVGGYFGASGSGTLVVAEYMPPPPPPMIGPHCVTTIFASNNGGAVGGAVYFDLTTTQPVSIAGLFVNTSSTQPLIGADLYTTPGTFAGQEGIPGAWTQVGTGAGNGTGQGVDTMTYLEFTTPVTLPVGTIGLAIVARGFDHRYTNGSGANQMYVSPDGILTTMHGSATNAPFDGFPFSPRVWNGVLCNDVAVPGVNYCMTNPNSTGSTTVMGASGSASVSANDLVLEASDMPTNSFSFFVTSQTQGFVANPNGSQGNLCVSGSIGRYVGPGQIQNSGPTGTVALAIDNAQTPQPTALVQIVAGETWNFQLWHRDANPGPVSNFSDGLEILFFH